MNRTNGQLETGTLGVCSHTWIDINKSNTSVNYFLKAQSVHQKIKDSKSL